jgi:hypothetical protein
MTRQLTLVHTVGSLVPIFGALVRELAPDVTATSSWTRRSSRSRSLPVGCPDHRPRDPGDRGAPRARPRGGLPSVNHAIKPAHRA